MSDVSKKTGVLLLVLAVVLAGATTLGILNYFSAPKEVELVEKAPQSGEVTLTVREPPKIREDASGSVGLTITNPKEGSE